MSKAIVTDADRADLHRKMDAEIAKTISENAKLSAEILKLIAETNKINREMRAYPWLSLATAFSGSTGMIGAIVALVVAFHH